MRKPRQTVPEARALDYCAMALFWLTQARPAPCQHGEADVACAWCAAKTALAALNEARTNRVKRKRAVLCKPSVPK